MKIADSVHTQSISAATSTPRARSHPRAHPRFSWATRPTTSAITTANPPLTTGNVLQTDTRLVDIEDPADSRVGHAALRRGTALRDPPGREGEQATADADARDHRHHERPGPLRLYRGNARHQHQHQQQPQQQDPGVSLDPTTRARSPSSETPAPPTTSRSSPRTSACSTPMARTTRSRSTPTKPLDANGESVRTTFFVYDSLGNTVNIDVTFVLDSRQHRHDVAMLRRVRRRQRRRRCSWRPEPSSSILADSSRPPSPSRSRSTGGLGHRTPPWRSPSASATGRTTSPPWPTPRPRSPPPRATGVPIGTLTSFGVGTDGTITGSFSNGMTRTLGRSGPRQLHQRRRPGRRRAQPLPRRAQLPGPVITQPGNLGTGRIRAARSELSNVKMAKEFHQPDGGQTGYSASSRVIQTTNDLFQQLLVLAR